jgi:tetratricopeptide (TPR) repeat protein
MRPLLSDSPKRVQAKTLRVASWCYYAKDDFATTFQMHRQGFEMYRDLGDEKEMSTSLQFMGVISYAMGNRTVAKDLLEQSLALSRKVNNKAAMPRVLMHLGHLAGDDRNTAAMEQYYQESLDIAREIGEGHLLMMVLGTMGTYAFLRKNYTLARNYYNEKLEIGVRLKNKRTLGETLLDFADIFNVEERFVESAWLQGFAENLFAESEVLTESHLVTIKEKGVLPKRHLGEAAYQREFEQGRKLDLEQIVKIAMTPLL